MIFVDTSAWFARIIPTDKNHSAAVAWMDRNSEPLLTTDYVVDETLTLLKMRKHVSCALALGEALFSGKLTCLHYLDPEEIREAWTVFEQYKDKNWSFTDCTSKVVMERVGVHTAFAFDRHFHQFGSIEVVPALFP